MQLVPKTSPAYIFVEGSIPLLSANRPRTVYKTVNYHRFGEHGELPERSIGPVLKTGDLVRGPGVRIPHSPQMVILAQSVERLTVDQEAMGS